MEKMGSSSYGGVGRNNNINGVRQYARSSTTASTTPSTVSAANTPFSIEMKEEKLAASGAEIIVLRKKLLASKRFGE